MNPISVPADPPFGKESESTNPMQGIGLPDSIEPQSNFIISDLLRTDLYVSQVRLQYAMWTLAASLSSQLQDIRESLYQCAQKLLESLEWMDENFLSIEHVQARLLICIYELMRKDHQRGWMSAGRCFRLMQLMRLHEVDDPENVVRRKSVPNAENWIHQEERRRVFWMAYSLDLFISVRGKWPLTLHEYTTSTCLPVPEDNFQHGNYMEMPCLSDPTRSLAEGERSPFTESIILASVCRYLAVHRQQSATEGAQGTTTLQAFWDRHNWLSEMLKSRTGPLALDYPTSLQHSDPMLLFTSMTAHALVLCLCTILEAAPCETADHQNAVAAFRHRALLAARRILALSRSLAHLSYLKVRPRASFSLSPRRLLTVSAKVHPFTPLPLRICADFFNTHRYLDEAAASQVREIEAALGEIGSVNNLARDYLLA
ncbi:hypothetical protein MMC17_002076 [Xylographa soralifera]|nr:hypothetical protein [Xylographa soralifera]